MEEIKGFEVRACIKIGETEDGIENIISELFTDEDQKVDFYGIYLRLADGTLQHVKDFKNVKEVEQYCLENNIVISSKGVSE